jgi:hypothetical protein
MDKGLESTFNSMNNSKFWIRMKNGYPNLREIAMKFLLCVSTTHLCETVFSAMTKQRNPLQQSVPVWVSLELIPELLS